MNHSGDHDIDPTFYRSPADAINAPPERLAYVVAFDRAAQRPDALVVLDVSSPCYCQGNTRGRSVQPSAASLQYIQQAWSSVPEYLSDPELETGTLTDPNGNAMAGATVIVLPVPKSPNSRSVLDSGHESDN
jgi:56kDa selenium binding protein (SBP56)